MTLRDRRVEEEEKFDFFKFCAYILVACGTVLVVELTVCLSRELIRTW